MQPDTSHPLAGLCGARAIALVEASEKSLWTKLMVDNHHTFGFESRLHLVNPRSASVCGQPTAPSCAAIRDTVDVAYIAVPRAATMDALKDVAAAGIPFCTHPYQRLRRGR